MAGDDDRLLDGHGLRAERGERGGGLSSLLRESGLSGLCGPAGGGINRGFDDLGLLNLQLLQQNLGLAAGGYDGLLVLAQRRDGRHGPGDRVMRVSGRRGPAVPCGRQPGHQVGLAAGDPVQGPELPEYLCRVATRQDLQPLAPEPGHVRLCAERPGLLAQVGEGGLLAREPVLCRGLVPLRPGERDPPGVEAFGGGFRFRVQGVDPGLGVTDLLGDIRGGGERRDEATAGDQAGGHSQTGEAPSDRPPVGERGTRARQGGASRSAPTGLADGLGLASALQRPARGRSRIRPS